MAAGAIGSLAGNVNANNALLVSPEGGYATSSGSTSTTPLAGDATFTGEWELNGHPEVLIQGKTDAAGTLYVDFSNDGTNADSTVPPTGISITAGVPYFQTFVKGPRYFRTRIVNGSSAQTYLRHYVHYGSFSLPNTPITLATAKDQGAIMARVTDHNLDIAKGLRGGHSRIHKFGYNPSVGTTEEDIWTGGGSYTGWLTAASAVRIRAGGNAADTAAGAGAQAITIVGLDENWVEAEESIATNGESASSATTTTFIRIFRAYVTNVGAYGVANTGAMLIETTAGTLVAQIGVGLGQTQLALYSIPAKKTGYITDLSVFVDGSKSAEAFFWQRRDANDVTTPFTGKRTLTSPLQGITGSVLREFPAYLNVPAMTDIWVSAIGPSGGTSVAASFSLYLVED